MDEWTALGMVVSALVILVGLFLTIGKPVITLNTTIVRLNANIEAQERRLEQQEKALEDLRTGSHESHRRLWNKNMEQDKIINGHEQRIDSLEREN